MAIFISLVLLSYMYTVHLLCMVHVNLLGVRTRVTYLLYDVHAIIIIALLIIMVVSLLYSW